MVSFTYIFGIIFTLIGFWLVFDQITRLASYSFMGPPASSLPFGFGSPEPYEFDVVRFVLGILVITIGVFLKERFWKERFRKAKPKCQYCGFTALSEKLLHVHQQLTCEKKNKEFLEDQTKQSALHNTRLGKGNKIPLLLLIAVVGFFAIVLGASLIWEEIDPEGYATFLEERGIERPEKIPGFEMQSFIQEVQKLLPVSFDPEVVQSAKKYIPLMQTLPKQILEQCENVNSYSDYQSFSLAVSIVEDEQVENLQNIDEFLTTLETQGYDKHPEVGPLISETRSVVIENGACLDDINRKYGTSPPPAEPEKELEP